MYRDLDLTGPTLNNRFHANQAFVHLGILDRDKFRTSSPVGRYLCPPKSTGSELGGTRWTVATALGRLLKDEIGKIIMPIFLARLARLKPPAHLAVRMIQNWQARVVVAVADAPDGLTVAQVRALAERFTRPEPSRSDSSAATRAATRVGTIQRAGKSARHEVEIELAGGATRQARQFLGLGYDCGAGLGAARRSAVRVTLHALSLSCFAHNGRHLSHGCRVGPPGTT